MPIATKARIEDSPPVMKFPKTVGAAIDQLYKLREERLSAQRAIDKIGDVERALEHHIQNLFSESELNGAKGSIATASIKISEIPQITDWDKFRAFLLKKKDWTLLNKSPSITTIREYWDNGVKIPGVDKMTIKKLSLTKIPR